MFKKAMAGHYAVPAYNFNNMEQLQAMIRKVLSESPSEFDPRKYLGTAREELKKLIIAKNTNVLGSAGKT